MRKFIPLFLMVVVALSGCNFPVQPTSPAPSPDVLGTQVAQRLTSTAAAIQIPPLGTQTSIPLTPMSSKSVSPSPLPSSTPLATKTLIPSLTQVPSLTLTNTATPTPIPGDPAANLGKPTWNDTFQKASVWGLQSPYDDGHTRVSIENGRLLIKSYDSNNWRGWRMMNTKIQNFYLETTIQTQACADGDLYGLLFRSPDNAKAYWLNITCDGHYSLDAGDINKLDSVIPSKTTSLLKAGSNQTNRLGVMAQGDKISLYANGQLIESVTNTAIGGPGAFGYFIAAKKTAGFTIAVTEVQYWELP